jgi:hypothetical protein
MPAPLLAWGVAHAPDSVAELWNTAALSANPSRSVPSV